MAKELTKANVSAFNRDVSRDGSYAYTTERLSSILANKRITEALEALYPLAGKRLLDLGCGDGAYSVELVGLGAAFVVGIDPSEAAVAAAAEKAAQRGMADRVRFEVGNIYALTLQEHFDCIVLRGVLHHLPDAAEALKAVSHLADTVLIMEPNGINPVVKILERTSRYHIEHEEQSFLPSTLLRWLRAAGFSRIRREYVNLVPMFCPDALAKVCKFFEPLVEAIPLVKHLCCGQIILYGEKRGTT
jgi:2-polyprenyl-3-methyl-5-hydroxy-6-metoxy-1,4-benzoquinol methylase